MSYNGANIFAYQYQNLNSDGTPIAPGDLTAGGTSGPGGDSYLYAHFQLDAQVTTQLTRGLSLVVVRTELEQRGLRLLQRQPAVRRAARVLQADVCDWLPVRAVDQMSGQDPLLSSNVHLRLTTMSARGVAFARACHTTGFAGSRQFLWRKRSTGGVDGQRSLRVSV